MLGYGRNHAVARITEANAGFGDDKADKNTERPFSSEQWNLKTQTRNFYDRCRPYSCRKHEKRLRPAIDQPEPWVYGEVKHPREKTFRGRFCPSCWF